LLARFNNVISRAIIRWLSELSTFPYIGPVPEKKRKRRARWLLWVLLIAIGFIAYKTFGPNTGGLKQGSYLYVHTGSGYQTLLKTLRDGDYVADIQSFKLLAELAKLPEHVRPGKYHIAKGMSNFAIIRMLRAGRQTPVKLVVNKLRTKNDFIKLVSQNLEADSTTLYGLLHDTVFLSDYGLDSNTALCAIMPNTYDFYWNTPADKALEKIARSYTEFWTADRKAEARSQGVAPVQAIIIASIVDEETNKNDEKPTIASVYLNRIRKDMRLQADPTVRYAIGDFSIRRITGKMLTYTSPYNTYMNKGLPPGPICTPSAASIDAVLNAPATNYIFFCAKADFSGYHSFAATDAEQLKNAHAYQQALDAKGIR
jgi:UPF0755 protein